MYVYIQIGSSDLRDSLHSNASPFVASRLDFPFEERLLFRYFLRVFTALTWPTTRSRTYFLPSFFARYLRTHPGDFTTRTADRPFLTGLPWRVGFLNYISFFFFVNVGVEVNVALFEDQLSLAVSR